MPSRRNSINRCERCRIYKPLCFCSEIPSIDLGTRVLVLMHSREQKLTTNSATLACMALKNSEILVRGGQDRSAELPAILKNIESVALLFPFEDAVELTPTLAQSLPPRLTVIVPDGSWRQARRLANRVRLNSAARKLILLKLPQGSQSVYRLRKESQENHLSTCESIARALGVIESRDVQMQLEKLFNLMVERRLWSQGKLPASQCSSPIPEAAFEAMRRAGIEGSVRTRKSDQI